MIPTPLHRLTYGSTGLLVAFAIVASYSAASLAMPPAAASEELGAAAPTMDPEAQAATQSDARVIELNARVRAEHEAKLAREKAVQDAYEAQLADYRRGVEKAAEAQRQYQRALVQHKADVAACAAGDFSKCGGPPVRVTRTATAAPAPAKAREDKRPKTTCRQEALTGSLMKKVRTCS